ncbi:MAG: hypothetical protein GXX85_09325 [Ignavibacteria bacterium]|nr:hypothetical protein [Ignavibacteria bacterium]
MVFLTFLIMFYFKDGSLFSSFFNTSQKDLKNFLALKLKPVFDDFKIGNEDIFNFALFNHLPIDNDKKNVLRILPDENQTIIELNKNSRIDQSDNYKNFAEMLNLSEEKQKSLDSLMEVYKNVLNSNIYSGNKNLIAVNAKIAIINQKLKADLIWFTSKNLPEADSFFFKRFNKNFYDRNKTHLVLSKQRTNDFVVFTSDSVYNINLDLKSFRSKGKENLGNTLDKVARISRKGIPEGFKHDENYKVARIKHFHFKPSNIKEFLKFKKELDSAITELNKLKYADLKNPLNLRATFKRKTLPIRPDDDSELGHEFNFRARTGDNNLELNDSTLLINAEGIKININVEE